MVLTVPCLDSFQAHERSEAQQFPKAGLHPRADPPSQQLLQGGDQNTIKQRRQQDDGKGAAEVEESAIQLHVRGAQPRVHLAGLGVEVAEHSVVKDVESDVAHLCPWCLQWRKVYGYRNFTWGYEAL